MTSEEEIAKVETRSAVLMIMSLNSGGSTLVGLDLKRAETRKEICSAA